MVNPALFLVSALFFLGISAVLYLAAWPGTIFVKRIAPRWSAQRGKALFFAALLLPPFTAGALTAGGVLLRHSHAPGKVHHGVACEGIARFLSAPEGKLPIALGILLQGAAWLLVAWGLVTVLRLVIATIQLERGLQPYLQPPSPKLALALARLRERVCLGKLPFFEAEIPMEYSCLIGVRHVRCVLSRALVASVSSEELEAIVMHEVSHLHAGDVWRTLIVGTLNCLFFYLQPVRLLAQRWREEAEIACDAATTRATHEPLALASAILRAQGVPMQAHPLPTTALGFAEETACAPEKRVERLLAYAREALPAPEASGYQVWQWAITIAIATVGAFCLLSPGTLCLAHCSLEAIARTLR